MLKSITTLLNDRLQKGGPGSGRYPKGSGETRTISEDPSEAYAAKLMGVSAGNPTLRMMLKYKSYETKGATAQALASAGREASKKYPVDESALKEKIKGGGEILQSSKNALSNFPESFQKDILGNLNLIRESGKMQGGATFKQQIRVSTGEITKSIVISKEEGLHPKVAEAMLTHEFAHAFDNSFNKTVGASISDTKEYTKVALEGRKSVTSYANRNEKEHFAEHLTAFIYMPDKLKEINPPIHGFFTELYGGKRDFTKSLSKEAGIISTGNSIEVIDDFNGSIVEMFGEELEKALLKGGPGSGRHPGDPYGRADKLSNEITRHVEDLKRGKITMTQFKQRVEPLYALRQRTQEHTKESQRNFRVPSGENQ